MKAQPSAQAAPEGEPSARPDISRERSIRIVTAFISDIALQSSRRFRLSNRSEPFREDSASQKPPFMAFFRLEQTETLRGSAGLCALCASAFCRSISYKRCMLNVFSIQ